MTLTDEELLELDHLEASENLDEEQLERYNQLKEQHHQENIEEKKEQDTVRDVKGLSNLVAQSVEENYQEVEIVKGKTVRVRADFDTDDIKKFKQYQQLDNKFSEDQDLDDFDDEKIESIKTDLYDILGHFTVDYSKEDWVQAFEKNPELSEDQKPGLVEVMRMLYKIFDAVEEELEKFEEKKRR